MIHHLRNTLLRRCRLLGAALLLSACSGDDGGTPATAPEASNDGPPLVFSVSPIAVEAIRWITPLGNLNPPAHAVPTDHIYFYFANPDALETAEAKRTAFYAPAGGTVTTVIQHDVSKPDVKVFVRVNNQQTYYVDHLIPDAPLARGAVLSAGQRLGTTGSSYGIDLGVIDQRVTLSFVNPARYNQSDTLHAAAPLGFYAEPLRTELYGLVQRLGPEKDGRIDYDVAGRLAGNWFSEFGAIPLAFVYDTYDPNQVRISIPGIVSLPGVHAIAATDPLPKDIGPASGKVRLTLTPARTGLPMNYLPVGTLLVQMTGDNHLRIETFPLGDPAAEFTGNSRSFIR